MAVPTSAEEIYQSVAAAVKADGANLVKRVGGGVVPPHFGV
jgi:hypothetical protein